MSDPELLRRLALSLRPLPTRAGGLAVVLARGGVVPAFSVLSSGDVALVNHEVRVAIHAGSSAARVKEVGFALLVPADELVLRVEVPETSIRTAGHLAVMEGLVASIRPTAEPPWNLSMEFSPQSSGGTEEYVAFWRDLRLWLEGGAVDAPPRSPEGFGTGSKNGS